MIGLPKHAGHYSEGFYVYDECIRVSLEFVVCKLGEISRLRVIYAENTFDVIVSLHAIEQLENPREGIEQFKKISKAPSVFGFSRKLSSQQRYSKSL